MNRYMSTTYDYVAHDSETWKNWLRQIVLNQFLVGVLISTIAGHAFAQARLETDEPPIDVVVEENGERHSSTHADDQEFAKSDVAYWEPSNDDWQAFRKHVIVTAIVQQIADSDPDFAVKARVLMNNGLPVRDRIDIIRQLQKRASDQRRIASGDFTEPELAAEAVKMIVERGLAELSYGMSDVALEIGPKYHVTIAKDKLPFLRVNKTDMKAEIQSNFAEMILSDDELQRLAIEVFDDSGAALKILELPPEHPIFRGDILDQKIFSQLPESFREQYGKILRDRNPTLEEVKKAIAEAEARILGGLHKNLIAARKSDKSIINLDAEFDAAIALASGISLIDSSAGRLAKGALVEGKNLSKNLDSLLQAMEEGKAIEALDCIGNIAGSIRAVMSIMAPSSNQLILEQLIAIREQLNGIERQLTVEFARINRKLDELSRVTKRLISEVRTFNGEIFTMSEESRQLLVSLDTTLKTVAPEIILAILAKAESELQAKMGGLKTVREITDFYQRDLAVHGSELRAKFPVTVRLEDLAGTNLFRMPAATNHALSDLPLGVRSRISRDWIHYAKWTNQLCLLDESPELRPLMMKRLATIRQFDQEFMAVNTMLPVLLQMTIQSHGALCAQLEEISVFASGSSSETLQLGRTPGVRGIPQLMFTDKLTDVQLSPSQEKQLSSLLSSPVFVRHSHGPPPGSEHNVFCPLPEQLKKTLHISTKLGLLLGWIELRAEYITDPDRNIRWNKQIHTLDAEFELQILPIEGVAPNTIKPHFLLRTQFGVPRDELDKISTFPGPSFHNNFDKFVAGWFGINGTDNDKTKRNTPCPSLVQALEVLMADKRSMINLMASARTGPKNRLVERYAHDRNLLIAGVSATHPNLSATVSALPEIEEMRHRFSQGQLSELVAESKGLFKQTAAELKNSQPVTPPEMVAAETNLLLRLNEQD